MPPPPPTKRIKRPPKVLDEDDYTDALSHIIARDFFPGLVETQAQQEYLDALDSKDKQWIANAGRKLSDVMTPGARRRHPGLATPVLNRGRDGSRTPATPLRREGDTPANWAGDTPRSNMSTPASTKSGSGLGLGFSTSSRDAELIDVKRMGLGAFQQKYTSEDNESFYKILDKQNTKKREKHAWMWSGNKIPTARQILYQKEERKRLESQGVPSGEKKVDEGQVVLFDVKSKDADTRPARPDGWKSRPENSLMFVPGSVEDELETVQQRREEGSRAAPKQIVYHNTRVVPLNSKGGDQDEDGHGAVPPSPSISAIRDAIAGRPRPTDSEPGFTGGETPRVNGYAFVDEDEPEPTYDSNNQDDEDEEYHLRQLLNSQGGADSTPNPFRLRENRRREMLHHRMVEKASKSKRSEKIVNQTKTPVPLFPSSPMLAFGKTPGGRGGSGGGNATPGASKAALTPAAQRLWATVGNSTPRRMDSGGTGLKNIWTPTPRRAK